MGPEERKTLGGMVAGKRAQSGGRLGKKNLQGESFQEGFESEPLKRVLGSLGFGKRRSWKERNSGESQILGE